MNEGISCLAKHLKNGDKIKCEAHGVQEVIMIDKTFIGIECGDLWKMKAEVTLLERDGLPILRVPEVDCKICYNIKPKEAHLGLGFSENQWDILHADCVNIFKYTKQHKLWNDEPETKCIGNGDDDCVGHDFPKCYSVETDTTQKTLKVGDIVPRKDVPVGAVFDLVDNLLKDMIAVSEEEGLESSKSDMNGKFWGRCPEGFYFWGNGELPCDILSLPNEQQPPPDTPVESEFLRDGGWSEETKQKYRLLPYTPEPKIAPAKLYPDTDNNYWQDIVLHTEWRRPE